MIPPAAPGQGFVEDVEIQGHILDSLLLPKVLDEIITHGGSYVIKDIGIGQRQEDTSRYLQARTGGQYQQGIALWVDLITTGGDFDICKGRLDRGRNQLGVYR